MLLFAEPARIIPAPIGGDACDGRSAGAAQAAHILPDITLFISLCCDVFGYPEPDVQWYRLSKGPGDITFEDPIGNGTGDYNVDTS